MQQCGSLAKSSEPMFDVLEGLLVLLYLGARGV